jgi:hypothetical protein
MKYYVYYSYEEWGRGYIGSKPSGSMDPDNDGYFGSFSDPDFNPTEKIILGVYGTPEECLEAEVVLHRLFEVDRNPHFANKAKQTSSGFFYDASGTKNEGSSKARTEANLTNNPMKNPQSVQKMLDSRMNSDWYENYLESRRSESSREKSRVSALNQWTNEAREAMSERRRGNGNPCFGKKWWVNSNGETFYQSESPGPDWQRGRVYNAPLPL